MLGPRLQQPLGSIDYISGRRGNPLQVAKFGLGYALLLHVSGTMAFSQPAGVAAPTFQGGGPWNLISNLFLTVNGLQYDASMSGYALMVQTILAGRTAVNATAPLPAANGGTVAVNTNETWSWDVLLQLATSERDHNLPVGLLNFQNQAVQAYLNVQWSSEADILSLPGATTATFTGSIYARLVAQEAPTNAAGYKAIAPLLAQLHTWEEVPAVLSSGTAKPRILLPVGETYSRIAILQRYGGSPDLTNAAGLENIDLNYGGFHQIDQSAQSLQFAGQQRYNNHLPGDVYLIDMSQNLPSEVLHAETLPQLNLDLQYSAAPATTAISLLLERYRPA